jgi:hypothetical protein
VALQYILALVVISSSFGDKFQALGLEGQLSHSLHYLALADRREREHLLTPSKRALSCLADVELLNGIKDSKALLDTDGGLNGEIWWGASPAKIENLTLLRKRALTYFSKFLVASRYLYYLDCSDGTTPDMSTEIRRARYWHTKEWPPFRIMVCHGS